MVFYQKEGWSHTFCLDQPKNRPLTTSWMQEHFLPLKATHCYVFQLQIKISLFWPKLFKTLQSTWSLGLHSMLAASPALTGCDAWPTPPFWQLIILCEPGFCPRLLEGYVLYYHMILACFANELSSNLETFALFSFFYFCQAGWTMFSLLSCP